MCFARLYGGAKIPVQKTLANQGLDYFRFQHNSWIWFLTLLLSKYEFNCWFVRFLYFNYLFVVSLKNQTYEVILIFLIFGY